jgi:hypothetical protein
MNNVDFCYWLQGFFELSEVDTLTDKQVKVIKNHLNLTFKHDIDPARNKESGLSIKTMDNLHSGFHLQSTTNNDGRIRC